MKTTTALFCYSVLALGLLAGCSRDSPAPAAEGTYSRSVTYLDTTSLSRRDSTFKTPVLKTFARQNANYLTIFLQPTPDREVVTLSVLRAKLPTNLVGTYTFKTKLDNTPDAEFEYRIEIADKRGSSHWVYSWLIHNPIGSFTITGYDAKHQLVSGRFEVNMAGVSDPFALDSEFRPRRCNMAFQGSFANAPIGNIE
jgi:hypothetical protein